MNYIKLFGELRRQMNGAVADGMHKGGIDYGMNYGVSLPTIKSIAMKYSPNHSLAVELWRQEVRELQLAAAYIDDANLVTIEEFNCWSLKWENIEIAQVVAMVLLWRSPCAMELAVEWFEKHNTIRHISACHIIGKLASQTELHKLNAEDCTEPINSSELIKFITLQNNAFALREIYKYHPTLRERIQNIASQIPDLEWQLDYLDL